MQREQTGSTPSDTPIDRGTLFKIHRLLSNCGRQRYYESWEDFMDAVSYYQANSLIPEKTSGGGVLGQ